MYRVRTIGFYTTTVYEGFDYHEASYVFGTMHGSRVWEELMPSMAWRDVAAYYEGRV